MKTLFFLLLLCAFFGPAFCQVPTDTTDFNNKVRIWLVTNGAKQITAQQINNLFLGVTHIFQAYGVDSLYIDTATNRIYGTRKGGKSTLMLQLKQTGAGAPETDPTVPSAVKAISSSDISNWNSKQSALTTVSGVTIVANVIIPSKDSALWNALKLRDKPIADSIPLIGQVLTWNGTSWVPATVAGGSQGIQDVLNVKDTITASNQVIAGNSTNNLLWMNFHNIDTRYINRARLYSDGGQASANFLPTVIQLIGGDSVDVAGTFGLGSGKFTVHSPTVMYSTLTLTSHVGNAGTDSPYVKGSDGTVKTISPTYYGTSSGGVTAIPSTPFLGYIYKSNSFPDLSPFTQAGSTFAASGGKIVVTNGTAGYGNILSYNYYSLLENWSFAAGFKINSTSGSSGGLALGIYSTASTAVHALGEFILSGANSGKVTLNLQNNTQYAISAGALSWSNGDSIVLVVSRNRDLIVVRATDITTTAAPVEAAFIYTVAGTPSMPTMGRFSVFNLGGTQSLTIDTVAIFSKELTGADVYCLGNSKFQYSVVSQFQNALIPRLGESFSVINGGAIGAQTADMLLLLPEIYALRPRRSLLGDVTRNDQGASISSTTYRSNLIGLYDSLHAHGIGVGIMRPFYERTIDQSAQDAWECANFPADSLIDSYTPIKNNAAAAVYSDNTHLTDFGDSLLYAPTIAYLTKIGLSATKTPALFGEGLPNSVALWKDGRHLFGNNLTFNNNNLDIPGFAAFGNFVNYNQEPIYGGPFPGGGAALFFTDPVAGTNQKTVRTWWHGGTWQLDAFKDDFSGDMNMATITGSGTTAPVLTFPGKTYINRATDDGSADTRQLQVDGGLSISTGSNLEIDLGLIGHYDHYMGMGRLSDGSPYHYWQNLNAGTNQKLYDWKFNTSGIADFRALADAAAGAVDVFQINRSAYPTVTFNFQVPVGIGTTAPNASALLDLTSTTQGLLIPRMTTTQRDAISSPGTGLQIFNTTTGQFEFYNSSAWIAVGGGGDILINAGSTYRIGKVGTDSLKTLTHGVEIIIDTATANQVKISSDTAASNARIRRISDSTVQVFATSLDVVSVKEFITTNATTINVDTIPISPGEHVTVTTVLDADRDDGNSSVGAIKYNTFFMDASSTIHEDGIQNTRVEHYLGTIGGLSAANFTITFSGALVLIQFTGETSTNILGKTTTTVSRKGAPL